MNADEYALLDYIITYEQRSANEYCYYVLLLQKQLLDGENLAHLKRAHFITEHVDARNALFWYTSTEAGRQARKNYPLSIHAWGGSHPSH